MKNHLLTAIIAAIIGSAGAGVVIGLQSQEQELNLGLENTIPPSEDLPSTNKIDEKALAESLGWIPVSEGVAIKIVGQQNGHLIANLLINQSGVWTPAILESPKPGFEYASSSH